jgi:hypothetical protein
MDHRQQHLGAGAEEWLRRLASSPALAIVPDYIAETLMAAGLAQKAPGGPLQTTADGKAYLDERGIATFRPLRKRTSHRAAGGI